MGELPPVDQAFVRGAARRLDARMREKRKRVERRRIEAQEWARHVAERLGESDPTVRRIIGFGSTFETWRGYRMDSDVDLAVVGGDWSLLMRTIPAGRFEVSLVELELQKPEFRDHVMKRGVTLYEKHGSY